jgi:hypothetical protein
MAMQCHLSRGDALFAIGEYYSAEDAYADALVLDPSIRRSKSFKVCAEPTLYMVPTTVLWFSAATVLTLPCPGPPGETKREACQCQ